MSSQKKSGPLCKRKPTPNKGLSEQLLQFGETVQLPGGVPTTRKFDGIYVPNRLDTEGLPLPRGSLYDR